jgi:glycosyltransferase involved in cell wall biosynthesis
MKISIVTPTMNALPQLKLCVKSVGIQNEVESEHIICDGVSTDGTQEWLAKQPGIKWKSAPDSGMYDALNHGFESAAGDILAWLNSDEQYLKGTLHTVLKLFEEHPEVDFISGDYIVVASELKPLMARKEIPLRGLYVKNGILNLHSCAFFFRRSLWEKCGKFDTTYKVCGDHDWILRAIKCSIKTLHHHGFLSLFTLDNSNLSYSPNAKIETDAIRIKFGGSKHRAVRNTVKLLRLTEKLLRGCYGISRLNYTAFNSVGDEETFVAKVGTRWRIQEVSGERSE